MVPCWAVSLHTEDGVLTNLEGQAHQRRGGPRSVSAAELLWKIKTEPDWKLKSTLRRLTRWDGVVSIKRSKTSTYRSNHSDTDLVLFICSVSERTGNGPVMGPFRFGGIIKMR